MAKQNAFLANLKAQAEKKAAAKSEAHVEIDTIALLLSGHDVLKVGPGRAGMLLNSFLAWKLEIAEAIVKELDEDQSKQKELVIVQRDLAKRIKEILGPEGWDQWKTLFPLLKEYW